MREVEELLKSSTAEAHRVHLTPSWHGSSPSRTFHCRMLQKDRKLSIQIDVTATPRHNNGAIFVQTVSDYPLVEAIAQEVVVFPCPPPDAASPCAGLATPGLLGENRADYLKLGVEEWRKSYAEHEKLGKKAVLFVMVDDTRNCDAVGDHLKRICPEFGDDGVLVIHTKQQQDLLKRRHGREELNWRRCGNRHLEIAL